MQALHFAFGLGACVAPLVAAPFLEANSCNMTAVTQTPVSLTTTLVPSVQSMAKRQLASDTTASLSPALNFSDILCDSTEHYNVTNKLCNSTKTLISTTAVHAAITTTSTSTTEPPPRKPSNTGRIVQQNKDLKAASAVNLGKDIDEAKKITEQADASPTKHQPTTTKPASPTDSNGALNSMGSTESNSTNPPAGNVSWPPMIAVTKSADHSTGDVTTTLTYVNSLPVNTTVSLSLSSGTDTKTTNNSVVQPSTEIPTTTADKPKLLNSPSIALTTESVTSTTKPVTSTMKAVTSSTKLPTKSMTITSLPADKTSVDTRPTAATKLHSSNTVTASNNKVESTSKKNSSTSKKKSSTSSKKLVTDPVTQKAATTGSAFVSVKPGEVIANVKSSAYSVTSGVISTSTSSPTINTTSASAAQSSSTSASQSPRNSSESEVLTTANPVKPKNTGLIKKFENLIKSISKVQYSYLVIAGVMLCFGFIFCFMDCKNKEYAPQRQRSENDLHEVTDRMINAPTQSYKIKLMTAVFVFFFLYVGTEVAYGQFIATFSIHYINFTEKNAAFLTAVYWGAFAATRGLSVLLAKCLSPAAMLNLSIVIALCSSIGLTIAMGVLVNNIGALWVLTGSLGVGMAAIFPTGVLWLEGYITVTSKMAAVFVCASALGEMVIPGVVGFLFDHTSPMVLMYFTLACILGCALTYGVMRCIVSNNHTPYRKVNSNSMQMQEFEFSDSDETDSEPILQSNGMNKRKNTLFT